ncbi:MAG: hypothetical protein LBS21_07865 [Clostridiales bacterium]|jgi:hypothetical protein|nr:hypothetical protein [Clostridiales bacterium]
MQGFDEAMQSALSQRKYDILTGRAPDLRERALDIMSSIYENILEPILNRIRMSIPDSAGSSNTQLLRNIFIAVGVAVLLLCIFFIVKYRRKKSYRNKTMNEIMADLDRRVITYEKLLQDADSFAQRNMFRDAIRYEYISLLWVLNGHGIIYLTDSKTNTILKNEVKRGASAIYSKFSGIVDIFNFAWFGHKKISEEVYRGNRTSINNLIREAHLYEKTA